MASPLGQKKSFRRFGLTENGGGREGLFRVQFLELTPFIVRVLRASTMAQRTWPLENYRKLPFYPFANPG